MKLYSPMKGDILTLDFVKDEMFSQRMLGDGIAIMPKQKEVYSPIDGKVKFVYETQHAIGMETSDGIEILIHIGIDTVMLKGKPFHTVVRENDVVAKGDLLTIVDWDEIQKAGYDCVTPIIVMNHTIKLARTKGNAEIGDLLFTVV